MRDGKRRFNAGRLTSDNAWFDHNRRLRPSETEIDHIIPIGVATGNSSNFYWNAQVTSKDYNNQKGNNLDNVFRANYMAAPGVGSGGRIRRARRTTNRYTPY